MTAALVIARKDLRQRFRDRSAIIIGVVAPVVILDRGPIAAGLIRSLEAPALRTMETPQQVPSVAAAQAEIRANKIGAALVIPAGFSADVVSDKPVSLTTMRSDNSAIAGDVTS